MLIKRAPKPDTAWSLIDAQHQAVRSCLDTAGQTIYRFISTEGSADAKQAIINACRSLYEILDQHFSIEEQRVLPIAAQVVTPAEWGHELVGCAISMCLNRYRYTLAEHCRHVV
jgi:hemerythrin-like domain-containing protein